MKEAEWLSATDPTPMLASVKRRASDRKLRLYAVECCHIARRNGADEGPDVECVVRLADGADNLEEVRAEWRVTLSGRVHCYPENPFNWCSAFSSLAPDKRGAEDATEDGTSGFPTTAELVALCHELFGNPFRPVRLKPAWLTTDVRLLATGIYEEKAFDRMPILADALQDAGCANDDLLNHLRSGGPHARGCWALDLLLGKS